MIDAILCTLAVVVPISIAWSNAIERQAFGARELGTRHAIARADLRAVLPRGRVVRLGGRR